MQLQKKGIVIGMLDKAIAYGEDLKSRIESDSENNLETLKSEYETWRSDNETSLAEIIPNHKSHYPPAPFHVENHSRAEILGDSEDESAWISRYNRQRQRLILGVENEIKGLSSIRKKIKDGTLDF
ncbi:hypothetical protein F4X10_14970 [Candidatus Poribacteria bacterium]|nr:hypothetical protein [Candidatus Poribacteria bacterium]